MTSQPTLGADEGDPGRGETPTTAFWVSVAAADSRYDGMRVGLEITWEGFRCVVCCWGRFVATAVTFCLCEESNLPLSFPAAAGGQANMYDDPKDG